MPESDVPGKKRYGIDIDPDDLEKLRKAAFWTPDETVTSIMVKGALAYASELETERGSPFPPREGEVRTGRPRKV